MKILMFRPEGHEGPCNYGDEMNIYLWPRIIPELNNIEKGIFVGIGTMLRDTMPQDEHRIVFGTGAGYDILTQPLDADVRFVRGPKTAEVIGMPHKAVTDPVILVHRLLSKSPTRPVAFMPRWTQLLRDPSIPERLEKTGIHTIDPLWPVEKVMMEIASTQLLITEALHGAVTADALRIPWIPVVSEPGHMFKWFDWTQSMRMKYDPVFLNVSSVPWARDHGTQHLSEDSIFRARLWEVESHVTALRAELRAQEA